MVTRQTNQPGNLTMGDSQILIGAYGDTEANSRDVGLTEGGVSYNHSTELYEATADQFLSVIDVKKIGERLEVSFTMKEDTLENMALAWDLPDSAIDEANNVLNFGGDDTVNYRCLYVNGPAPGGGTAKWELWKVVAMDVGETTYNKEGEALKEITMLVLEDTTKPKGQRFGKRSDVYDDTIAPVVSSVSPTDAATTVAVTTTVEWTFSEPIQERDITSGNFNLVDASGTEVSGSLAYDKGTNKVIFTPDVDLSSLTTYLAFASGEVRDLAGNKMGSNYRTNFETA